MFVFSLFKDNNLSCVLRRNESFTVIDGFRGVRRNFFFSIVRLVVVEVKGRLVERVIS